MRATIESTRATHEAQPRMGWVPEASALSNAPSPLQVIEAPYSAKALLKLKDKLEEPDDAHRVASYVEQPGTPMADLTSMV